MKHSKSWWNNEYNLALSKIDQQGVLRIGNHSRARSNHPNILSLISKFKKSLTRRENLGNS